MRRPRRLYETPAEWGPEIYLLARHEVERAVRELREMGYRVAIDDCRVWYHVGGDRYDEPRSGRVIRVRYDRSSESWVPVAGETG